MDHKKSNVFHPLWSWTHTNSDAGEQTGNQCQRNFDGFNEAIKRAKCAEKAEGAAINQQAEKLSAAMDARNDSVRQRLGLSDQCVTQPSPPPPAVPRRSAKASWRGQRLSPLLDGPRPQVEDIHGTQGSPDNLDEEDDDSYWDKVLLGSQMAARGDSPTASVGSVSILGSVDSHTPRELRAIPLIGSPVEQTFRPAPPPHPRAAPLAKSRASRLPVFSAKFSGADKEVADGCRLQSAQNKVDAVIKRLEQFRVNSIASTQLTVVPQRSTEQTSSAPMPPKVPHTNGRGTRPRTLLRPAKAAGGAGTKTSSLQTAKDNKVELRPLVNPVASLPLFFKLLSSDDWMKKIEGLKIMQALAQHHSEIVTTKLHEVCLVLIKEVNNLRSAVSCAAMNTLTELYVHFEKTMDPEVEGTGRALLLKLAQTTNAFIHQQANMALDAMVQKCSSGRVVSALLNTGLSHLCVAVRASTAQHLHQLADALGASRIMAAGRSFTERFLTAVSKLSVDAAPQVRYHGQMILQELGLHKDFLKLWTKIIPDKDRRPLDKVLRRPSDQVHMFYTTNVK